MIQSSTGWHGFLGAVGSVKGPAKLPLFMVTACTFPLTAYIRMTEAQVNSPQESLVGGGWRLQERGEPYVSCRAQLCTPEEGLRSCCKDCWPGEDRKADRETSRNEDSARYSSTSKSADG